MGFVVYHSVFSTHYSPCYLQPPSLLPSPVNALTRRKNRAITACLQQESPRNGSFCKRRAILYMGFAAIPLLQLRAAAVEGLAAGNTELKTLDQKKEAESVKGNPFLSLLNVLGYLGAGVLAPLYFSLQKEKATSDATLESINAKLKEKKETITFLEKKFELDLLNERESKTKAIAKANEERLSVLHQLEVANGTIRSLGQDLQKEKKSVEKKTIEIENLEITLCKAQDEKRELQDQLKEKNDSLAVLQERVNLLSSEIKEKEENLQNVNAKLVDKEGELEQLGSVYQQAQDQLIGLKLEVQGLKDVVVEKEKELDLKCYMLDNLNADLASSRGEIDESRKKFDDLLQEYDLFKSNAEKKADSDTKLLAEKEEALRRLEGKLEAALDDVKNSKELISVLTNEKENLTERLNAELKNVENLEMELKIAEEKLEKSRGEAADLAKQLEEMRSVCLGIEAELSKIQNEFKETRDSLEREIDETKQGKEVLNGELMSAKELLARSNEELQAASQELSASVQKCGILEVELNEANLKAESATRVLEEERKTVSSLKNELEALETQIRNEKGARKILESDLEECTKSLDEMNRNISMLSRELNLANTRVLGIEDERDALLQALDEQKRVAQEAKENLEDAQSMVMKLGKERENLENRGQKLEEELGSAKGEILRLKSQMNSPKTRASKQMVQDESAPRQVNSSKNTMNNQDAQNESATSQVNSEKNPTNEENKQEVKVGSKSGAVPTKRATRKKKS